MYRRGVKALLGDKFTVDFEAAGISDATRWPAEPHLVLVDDADGQDQPVCTALRRRFPAAKLVFLLRRSAPEQAIDIIRHGAHGVLGPQLSAEALVLSLRLVLLGQVLVPSFVMDLVHDTHAMAPPSLDELEATITPREAQILEMIVRGHSNKRIGLSLGLQETTVKFYVKNVMRKLKVTNRTQIAVWAMTHGCPPDPTASADPTLAAAKVRHLEVAH
ncbi:hypothetical protein TSO352_02590 [Azospirillum sp. TSO35-2]|nr:hypothetical protein TSO352_02590 [Azospirillum sp. TSO35-2]